MGCILNLEVCMCMQKENVKKNDVSICFYMSIYCVLNIVIDFLQKLKYFCKTVSGGLNKTFEETVYNIEIICIL